jgi:hypothetical protein
MKKTISSEREKRNSGSKQDLLVDAGTLKILRTVGDHEAFFFYVTVGKPTGEVARNLSDFLEKLKTAKSESLIFHLERRDFENWVQRILGDSRLARQLGKISLSGRGDVRKSICRTVEKRIKELESTADFSVDDDLRVLIPPAAVQ